MRKKILCLLLALTTVFAVCACGGDSKESGEKSAFDSFAEVQKNMEDVRDAEFKMDMNMTTAGSGESGDITMKMTATGKEIVKSKSDIDMEMKYNMTIPGLGSDLEGNMYMKDQNLYMDMMGQKFKVDASNEMAAMMNIDTSQMLNITEDMISDLKTSQEGSDTVYTFKMDANKALDYFKNNAGGMQDLTGTSGDLNFDKMNVVVVAGEDQMVKSIDMDCSMATEAEGETVSMDYQISMEYLNLNTDLKIDFPDFSNYQELSV